ncbi:MAG: tetratricopeptide repeat protein [Actinomycetota bacterium]
MSTTILEVAEDGFERDVEQRSHEVPVVVDFWAAWCGPCRFLGPVLEKLCEEAGGAWVLAKVDVDANPGLAARFGIQGIPAVRAFKAGREVAEFVGALPEPQVREWLAQLEPSRADLAFEEGRRAEDRGDRTAAAKAFEEALNHDPGHAPARCALERVALSLRAGSLDENALRSRIDSSAADVDAAVGLADILAARGDVQGSSDVLLETIRSTGGEDRDRARRHLLRLLSTIPVDDPRARAARRSLSLALF